MNTDLTGPKLELLHAETTEQIIAAFYDVYNELGHGFLESVYQRAICIVLRERGLEVVSEAPISVLFRGQNVGEFFADLLVDGKVIVELKAARTLESVHEAQLLHYLRATVIEVGLILNFGPVPKFKRMLMDNRSKRARAENSP